LEWNGVDEGGSFPNGHVPNRCFCPFGSARALHRREIGKTTSCLWHGNDTGMVVRGM
jgi:hypothetical protein